MQRLRRAPRIDHYDDSDDATINDKDDGVDGLMRLQRSLEKKKFPSVRKDPSKFHLGSDVAVSKSIKGNNDIINRKEVKRMNVGRRRMSHVRFRHRKNHRRVRRTRTSLKPQGVNTKVDTNALKGNEDITPNPNIKPIKSPESTEHAKQQTTTLGTEPFTGETVTKSLTKERQSNEVENKDKQGSKVLPTLDATPGPTTHHLKNSNLEAASANEQNQKNLQVKKKESIQNSVKYDKSVKTSGEISKEPMTTSSAITAETATTTSVITNEPVATTSMKADKLGATTSVTVNKPVTTTSMRTDESVTTTSVITNEPVATTSMKTDEPRATTSVTVNKPTTTTSVTVNKPVKTTSMTIDESVTTTSVITNEPGTTASMTTDESVVNKRLKAEKRKGLHNQKLTKKLEKGDKASRKMEKDAIKGNKKALLTTKSTPRQHKTLEATTKAAVKNQKTLPVLSTTISTVADGQKVTAEVKNENMISRTRGNRKGNQNSSKKKETEKVHTINGSSGSEKKEKGKGKGKEKGKKKKVDADSEKISNTKKEKEVLRDLNTFTEKELEKSSSFPLLFLVLCILIIAAYAMYHNRQKIVAILVEGRGPGSNQRPSSRHYTKLEDAMPSIRKVAA
eukprot:gene12872-14197_t